MNLVEHSKNEIKRYEDFFPRILEITENNISSTAQRAIQLEALCVEHQQDYPFNVHAFKIPVPLEQGEAFWKMIQCKAVQPTLVVSRIKTCKITEVIDGLKHFKREPWIEGTPVPMPEDVFIDQESQIVLFVAKAVNFVAINRLIKDEKGIWFAGTYFDGIMERSQDQFEASLNGLVEKMREYMDRKEVDQFYQEHVVNFNKKASSQ